MRRRDFLTGAAALAAYAELQSADAKNGAGRPVLAPLGGSAIPSWIPNRQNPPDLAFNWTKNLAWKKGVGLTTPAALGVTTSRASVKQVVDNSGNWSQIASGQTAWSNLGRSTEEARTNGTNNNSMVGAAAGTPGTNPTNWSSSGNNIGTLTQTIVGTGVENGVSYIDYQFSGTTAGAGSWQIYPGFGLQGPSASYGQTWVNSAFVKLQAGSTANISAISLAINELTSGAGFITSGNNSIVPTSASLGSQRFTYSRTLTGATTAVLNGIVQFAWSGAVAINFTLRIGWPQLENNSLINSTVASGVMAASGTGGVNGTAVYTVGGGTGTAATLNCTWAAGVLTINSVASAGSYTVFPPSPATLTYASGTATGWTGATVTLTPTNNAASAFSTSPIVTSGSAVQRLADVTTMNVTGLVGSAYTLFEVATPQTPTTYNQNQTLLGLTDGSFSNIARMFRLVILGNADIQLRISGASTSTASIATIAQNTPFTSAASFIAGAQALSLNNAALVTQATGSLPSGLNTLNFGETDSVGQQLNGLATIDAIWLNQAVPNAQLQAMQATP